LRSACDQVTLPWWLSRLGYAPRASSRRVLRTSLYIMAAFSLIESRCITVMRNDSATTALSAKLLSRLLDFGVASNRVSESYLCASLDVAESLYRFPAAGIDVRTWSRIAVCGNTYHRRRILWHAWQTESQQPATAAAAVAAAAARCTSPLGYVIYRPVKGSVKISVAATRMRIVSAMSCICSLSRLENGRWWLLSDVRAADANLAIKSHAIPLYNKTWARMNN